MEEMVPVRLPSGGRLFVRAEPVGAASALNDEREIAGGRVPTLDQVIAAVGEFTDSIGGVLMRSAPNRFTVATSSSALLRRSGSLMNCLHPDQDGLAAPVLRAHPVLPLPRWRPSFPCGQLEPLAVC